MENHGPILVPPTHGKPIDPVAMARRDLARNQPRRFYKAADVAPEADGFALTLDGRAARTPAGQALRLPTRALAEAVAAEWAAQGETVDAATMPLTRLANTALDGVARDPDAVRADIVKYAGSDLLCYRAGEPEALVALQNAAWNPVLDWARDALGARFALAEGVMFCAQPAATIDAVATAVARLPAPFGVAAAHIATSLTGSAVLALALAEGEITAEEAWAAAHVDEDFQISQWGEDAEAQARRALRWADMAAAATVLRLGSLAS